MEPVLIQTHIPKTGGTALRQLIEANYERGEVVYVDNLEPSRIAFREHSDRWRTPAKAWREYYRLLPPEERSRIRCFCGHQAAFLIAAVDDRPVRAFCLLRDPVDRVISAYFYMLSIGDRFPPSNPGVQIAKALREGGWGLKEIYRELGGADDYRAKLPGLDEIAKTAVVATCFNGQTRHILAGAVNPDEVPLDSDGAVLRDYRDKAHAILSEKYVVGTQDRFSQSIRLFAESFGWQKVFEPRANVSRLRGGKREAEIDQETLSLIRRYNQADVDLHAHYSDRLNALPTVGHLTDLRARGGRLASRTRARLGLSKGVPRTA